MEKYISYYDKIDAIIELVEVLEIKGDNKLIQKLKEDATKRLLEEFNNITEPSYWLSIILESRKKLTNNK